VLWRFSQGRWWVVHVAHIRKTTYTVLYNFFKTYEQWAVWQSKVKLKLLSYNKMCMRIQGVGRKLHTFRTPALSHSVIWLMLRPFYPTEGTSPTPYCVHWIRGLMSFRAGLGVAAERNAPASAGNPTPAFQSLDWLNYHRTEYKLNYRGTYDVYWLQMC
jgi:hypothetical protein